MTHRFLGGLTMALASAATISACGGSSASSTTSAPSPAPSATTAAARPSNPSATPAMIAMGDSIYHARGCRNCHGPDGKGGPRAPDLTDGTTLHVNNTFDSYVKVITDGVPVEAIKDKSHTTAMRPMGGPPTPLTPDQIKAVAAYVMTLKKG